MVGRKAARQRDALPLPPESRQMTIAHRRIISERQSSDHVVDVGESRRLEHLVGVALRHPGDIFTDGSFEKGNRLRQITRDLSEELRSQR